MVIVRSSARLFSYMWCQPFQRLNNSKPKVIHQKAEKWKNVFWHFLQHIYTNLLEPTFRLRYRSYTYPRNGLGTSFAIHGCTIVRVNEIKSSLNINNRTCCLSEFAFTRLSSSQMLYGSSTLCSLFPYFVSKYACAHASVSSSIPSSFSNLLAFLNS